MNDGCNADVLDGWIDGLIEVDASGVIKSVNTTCSQKLGLAAANMIGVHVHDLLCEQSIYTDHEKSNCPLANSGYVTEQNKEAYWTTADHQNIAVSYRKVLQQGGCALVIFNTCEALGAQVDELKKLAAFTEINPVPLLEIDPATQIQFSNPAMTELMLEFGFNDDGVPNVLPDKLSSIVDSVISEERVIEGVESAAVSEDDADSISYFIWSFHPLESAHGRHAMLCGLDITSKKQMELQRKKYEQSIEQEKKKARKEYLAKMVHELRSPLNAVVGYANILKMKLAKSCSEQQLLLFDRIIDGGNLLADQISTTLEASRVESGKMQAHIEQFEVKPILQEVYERLLSAADQKRLSLELNMDEGEVKALADKQHLKQIVINLVSNAIKYTDAGTVKICLGTDIDSVVGNCVVVSVIDTGCGVPDLEKDSIFELFQRQTEHEATDIEGDGLGLAICVEMIELSHGRLTLSSEVGKGSNFSAILPR